MIEITEGLTSVSVRPDEFFPAQRKRPHTGARVSVEFSRASALEPGQCVCVRYDFSGNGHVRSAIGSPQLTRVEVRWGCAVLFNYRLTHWIEPRDLFVTASPERPVRPNPLVPATPAPAARTGGLSRV